MMSRTIEELRLDQLDLELEYYINKGVTPRVAARLALMAVVTGNIHTVEDII